jgi:hypothetical protein
MAACFVVRDQNGQQLAYIYFEDGGGHPPRSFSPKTMKDRRELLLNCQSYCSQGDARNLGHRPKENKWSG